MYAPSEDYRTVQKAAETYWNNGDYGSEGWPHVQHKSIMEPQGPQKKIWMEEMEFILG